MSLKAIFLALVRLVRRQLCPKCNRPGVFIRTRYFADGESDVWMCETPGCASHRLYWHHDRAK